MNAYLGIDLGSVSTNCFVLDDSGQMLANIYLRTQGNPIKAVQTALARIEAELPSGSLIRGVGTTGSGRQLAAVMVGADIVKNEITAHGIAAAYQVPTAKTVLEIGGQDSKIILLRDGIVTDFAMNTVCAAGTGSFLDRQAERLGLSIEQFGAVALESNNAVRIAGRCAVFAESDMIHKQQLGYSIADIACGLCQALVRNYLSNVAKGKQILPPVLFQGGVAANAGIKRAFEEVLSVEIIIPRYHDAMGALGACLLARQVVSKGLNTKFKGFQVCNWDYTVSSKHCSGCSNRCEVVCIHAEGVDLAYWGDRCGRWNQQYPA